MLVAIGVTGVVLSLGTATPVYGWLFTVFPPMQGLRAAARFGNLFLLAVAVLGGIGSRRRSPDVRACARRMAGSRRASCWSTSNRCGRRSTTSASTAFRASTGSWPTSPARSCWPSSRSFRAWAIFQNAPYVLASTAHWRPLMNGYSGYTPDSYQRYADAFWYFPEEWAIQAMKDAGVTHVMVHLAAFHKDHQPVLTAIEHRADFELMAIGRNDMRLYRLKRQ